MKKKSRRERGSDLPVLAVSMGDPAGVGPELCLRLLGDPEIRAESRLAVYGSEAVLERVSRATGIGFPRGIARGGGADACAGAPGHVVVECGADPSGIEPGRVSAAAGRMAAECVTLAVRAAASGTAAAVVTAPVSKDAFARAGVPYPGHTEMLADLTAARRICMTLASAEIVVSLVTAHVPVREVSSYLTAERVLDVFGLTHEAMLALLGRPPRIAVCGFNPHAGENGLLGREEADIILPAVREAKASGMDVRGPLPSDTAFLPARRAETDAYVAMYHDQGLIPFKMLHFDDGVNITLGLPVVRTSPDHGTAFDIAWGGSASPSSMKAAIRWAIRLSAARAGRM